VEIADRAVDLEIRVRAQLVHVADLDLADEVLVRGINLDLEIVDRGGSVAQMT
jgi:hypothetical protein